MIKLIIKCFKFYPTKIANFNEFYFDYAIGIFDLKNFTVSL